MLRRGLSQSGSTWGVFDPEKAKASLERSLVALQTDYIDLFLLHEPTLESAASRPLIDFLEGEVARGSIRAYGCGGEWTHIEKIATSGLPTSRWLQFEDNAIFRHLENAQASGANCITFAPFNTALPMLQNWLDLKPHLRETWSEELGVDCSEKANFSALLLAGALARNQRGIVLFSSKNAQRIEQASRVASGGIISIDQVERFLELTKMIIMETQDY